MNEDGTLRPNYEQELLVFHDTKAKRLKSVSTYGLLCQEYPQLSGLFIKPTDMGWFGSCNSGVYIGWYID